MTMTRHDPKIESEPAHWDWEPELDKRDAVCVLCGRPAVVERSARSWCALHCVPETSLNAPNPETQTVAHRWHEFVVATFTPGA